jgi:hypothetical protein
VEVLPSGKGNRAFWSDHGKAFVVACSGDREKKEIVKELITKKSGSPLYCNRGISPIPCNSKLGAKCKDNHGIPAADSAVLRI